MKWLIEEIPFPIDLEQVFAELYQEEPYAFWLDSSRLITGLSRYSMMGGQPQLILRSKHGQTEWMDGGGVRKRMEESPFAMLRRALDSTRCHMGIEPPLPFVGGWVGYVGYECNRYLEQVPVHQLDPTQAPDMIWMYVDQVLIYDHLEEKAYVSHLYEGDPALAKRTVATWMGKLREAMRQPPSPLSIPEAASAEQEETFRMTVTPDSYRERIGRIKEYIGQGDIYQACYTYQFETDYAEDPFLLYRILRHINPAPFAAYLRLGEWTVVSSSPERFLRMDEHRVVESRPIKGTRPRAAEVGEDRRLMRELETHPKDRAENVMIVDLVRNDLGRVCDTGSVRVPKLLQVESYATVHQLVSTVEGTLSAERSSLDVIEAAFPGGSMTGAPKIRAMEILHEMESVARGIYSGGLGYIDVRGSFDLSMVIRSIVCHQGKAFFHVGGGIVADSDPDREYQETLDKARALQKALSLAKWKRTETQMTC
ncbi:aminodeoxychorismate synthase component I [Laceyella putida]|uniref:aminodeoxychorismate synthase n=1 Tax=Laceyella putida TaxID=110101 RepID=A0ABW2RIH0_9BACL